MYEAPFQRRAFRRHILSLGIIAASLLWVSMASAEKSTTPTTGKSAETATAPLAFEERFSGEALDVKVWTLTRKNDFQDTKTFIDIVGTDDTNRRLRLCASTMGTDAKTVKYHGIRTLEPVVNLEQPVEIAFDLDWNNQFNGCYLSGGIVVSPEATDGNPAEGKNWLKLEYVGVAPGKTARMAITYSVNGRLRRFYMDGWPEKQREGRLITLQHVRLILTRDSIEVWENDQRLVSGKMLDVDDLLTPFPWTKGYLYLQQSSHSNYRAREIFFDNITVGAAKTLE